MLVDQVEGVTYNELVEIRQQNGEIRRGKVLEVDGDRALVQLFGSNGLQIRRQPRDSWDTPSSWASAWICWATCSTGMGNPRDDGPAR